MVLKPRKIKRMWDSWLYHFDNTYFLYYLTMGPTARQGMHGQGVALSTSKDGVHWDELGVVVHKDDDATGLGTGAIWKSTQGAKSKFVMNYSSWTDWCIQSQSIRFAESTDLITWTKLGPEYEFAADREFYETYSEYSEARWDCIYPLQRAEGGYYGYWTANPIGFEPGFGFGQSRDGVHWKALRSPRIDWQGTPPIQNLEVGAVERFGKAYFAILCSYAPHSWNLNGMFLFHAKSPEGPFLPAKRNYTMMHSPRTFRMSYFARFFNSPEGMLVHHHSMTKSDEVYFAPLKAVEVDEEGTLRLKWWAGNESLKAGQARSISSQLENGTNSRFLSETLHSDPGFILEGKIRPLPAAGPEVNAPGSGVYVEVHEGQGIAFLVDRNGRVRIGSFSPRSTMFGVYDIIDRELFPANEFRFRLMIRHSLAEFYLNDYHIQCWSFEEEVSGRIALLGGDVPAKQEDVSAWKMSLPAKA
jgi:hypothetical protein